MREKFDVTPVTKVEDLDNNPFPGGQKRLES